MQNIVDSLAIDLLWLRPGGVGGTEFFVRNLLDGFTELPGDFRLVLVLSENSAGSFLKYSSDTRIEILTVPIDNSDIAGRILWQNLHLNAFLREHGLRRCFSPVYDRPFFNGGIRYYNTIHDIQAYHYPKYHPLHEVVYSKLIWFADKYHSKHVFTTTDWVKEDLKSVYHFREEKMSTIPIPVCIPASADDTNEENDSEILSKWNLGERGYFYTVAQMIPHKNVTTLVKVLAEIMKRQERCERLPKTLVITGISGNATVEFMKTIREFGMEDHIILTGFISDRDKFCLYRHCHTFLFPSVFEGFGMPPVEAMECGACVVTTRRTSIPEVTQGHANYVSDPYDVDEWIDRIMNAENYSAELDVSVYDKKKIAERYLNFFREQSGV